MARTSGPSIQKESISTELNCKLSGLEDCIIFSKSGKVRGWILKSNGVGKVSIRMNFHFTLQRTRKITLQIMTQRGIRKKVSLPRQGQLKHILNEQYVGSSIKRSYDNWVINGHVTFWPSTLGDDHHHQKQQHSEDSGETHRLNALLTVPNCSSPCSSCWGNTLRSVHHFVL